MVFGLLVIIGVGFSAYRGEATSDSAGKTKGLQLFAQLSFPSSHSPHSYPSSPSRSWEGESRRDYSHGFQFNIRSQRHRTYPDQYRRDRRRYPYRSTQAPRRRRREAAPRRPREAPRRSMQVTKKPYDPCTSLSNSECKNKLATCLKSLQGLVDAIKEKYPGSEEYDAVVREAIDAIDVGKQSLKGRVGREFVKADIEMCEEARKKLNAKYPDLTREGRGNELENCIDDLKKLNLGELDGVVRELEEDLRSGDASRIDTALSFCYYTHRRARKKKSKPPTERPTFERVPSLGREGATTRAFTGTPPPASPKVILVNNLPVRNVVLYIKYQELVDGKLEDREIEHMCRSFRKGHECSEQTLPPIPYGTTQSYYLEARIYTSDDPNEPPTVVAREWKDLRAGQSYKFQVPEVEPEDSEGS